MRSLLVFTGMIVLTTSVFSQDVDYTRDVKPLLTKKCGACHSSLKQESGLRLDAGSLIHKGGDNGPILETNNPQNSSLIERVTSADEDSRMPPREDGEPLTEKQVAVLKNWIEDGAKFPEDETYLKSPLDHWAYQKPVRPAVPAIAPESVANPIDSFVIAQQNSAGLQSLPGADPYSLLRRAHIDLIGIPPTRKQMESFVRNPTEIVWQQVVEDLLASPHYGERWGRHWMDVWRYSDWDGYKNELRGSQRNIWHWRDWIIESLNDDKGYDQMVLEMLAADELYPDKPKTLAATGYLARNFHKSNRNIWLDATVEHTAKGFLGVTLNCARCHDHKYDPIAQQTYYQFRAIFEPHKVRAEQLDDAKAAMPRAYDADLKASTFVYIAGNDKTPDKDNPVSPETIEFLGVPFEVHPVQLPYQAYYPALVDHRIQRELDRLTRALVTAEKDLDSAIQQALISGDANLPNRLARIEQVGILNPAKLNPDTVKLWTLNRDCAALQLHSYQARVAAERRVHRDGHPLTKELAAAALAAEQDTNLKLTERTVFQNELALSQSQSSKEKDAKKKTAAIAKARKTLEQSKKKLETARQALNSNQKKHTPIGALYPTTSTGRRAALARWIVDRRNPLTARVAINQIWMRHFGEPLVENVFDFGLQSQKPIHADLLDWLAVELMENQWSMKHIHRLILNSKTWRTASAAKDSVAERNRELDPDNRLLWRMTSNRLDAEIVRDSLLAVANRLDPKMGGPEIDFQKDQTAHRRSVYLRHAYEKQSQMLVTFDAANPTECYRRSESIIPQQALALVNSPLALEHSRVLAVDLWEEVSKLDDAQSRFIQVAFLQILSRPVQRLEHEACNDFLQSQAELLSDTSKLTDFKGGSPPQVKPASDPQARARENLVHMLLNHNDFITIR